MTTPCISIPASSPSAADGPLVSIIVPVYNCETYLRESLDSILQQTYPHTELLVIDDASTDATPAIAASYGDRLTYYRQPQNRGIYGTMNVGIGMAKGELIAAYHSDDIYHPDIVEREVAFLQRFPEAGAVFCQDIFIDPEGRERGRLQLPPEVRGGRPLEYPVILNALLTYKNRIFRCPSCMVRASVYETVGTYRDQQFRNTSDLEMYLRIARHYPIGILEEYLFQYRKGHNSSARRYHHLRTDPERFFTIMDLYLEEGGWQIAAPDALAAYEAHRAEDRLMNAVSYYVLGQLPNARLRLRQIRVAQIQGSRRVQRVRLLILYLLLHGLVRVPRIPLLAHLFCRRWHGGGKEPSKGGSRSIGHA